MLKSLRDRRRFRRGAREEAARLSSLIVATRAEVGAAAAAYRDAHATQLGFPPSCPTCGRGTVAKHKQFSKKRGQWYWLCWGCGRTLPYQKLTFEVPENL